MARFYYKGSRPCLPLHYGLALETSVFFVCQGMDLNPGSRINNTSFSSKLMNWPNKLKCLVLVSLSYLVKCNVTRNLQMATISLIVCFK